MNRRRLTRYAWVSIGAAVVTMALKLWAYGLTGSVGLLSDAVESLVNLAGGVMALAMLTVAARPADEEHAYGHGKAEYFSSGVEGTLILIAGIGIAVAASQRLVTPEPLEQLGLGLAVSGLASLINLSVAMVLMGAGKRYDSITLQANAHHLLTDVWTSAGVLVGVGAVALTGWERLDAVVALLVASTILWAGAGILRRTVSGLMDTGLASADRAAIRQVFARYESEGVQFHALRTRQAGAWRFVSVHVLAPGYWTIHRGHALLERIEADIRQALPNTTVFTHLESLDDPASWEDIGLERARPRDPPTPGCPAAE
ncbi:MAG: cation transporter [Verrucomicrobia bacterium]|nr:cation transporter [Verrucomicrobiota bacterium]